MPDPAVPAPPPPVEPAGWRCPICSSGAGQPRWKVNADGSEGGVDAVAFRPSSDRFGAPVSTVVTCARCGHGSLDAVPQADRVSDAYLDASDPESIEEESGQVETARRALQLVERWLAPGPLLDIGCWTGSFLVAASERGWDPSGIEPSRWAIARARQRGLKVTQAEFDQLEPGDRRWRLVVMGDVLEHLADPGAAVERAAGLLEPGGGLYLTVPDAGSALARVMGRRWWSVLPMHVQYFTRASMTRLLVGRGFEIRHVGSHPKVFSARYYAGRLGGYHPAAARLAVGLTERLGVSQHLVGPDFHDRMVILATK